MTTTQTDAHVWKTLMNAIGNVYGVAGIMGNLYAESGMNPKNLQDSFEKKLGMSNEEYTKAVDSGAYKSFASDQAGYGLAQWTYSGRKQALYDFAKQKGTSIGDTDMQIEFLLMELEKYTDVLSILRSCNRVGEASDAFMLKFERPADQSELARVRRQIHSQGYLIAFQKIYVCVTGDIVWIRTGDSTEYPKIHAAKRGSRFEYAGKSLDENWNAIRIDDPKCIAWISAKYSKICRG